MAGNLKSIGKMESKKPLQKLNLGCGGGRKQGYVNVDLLSGPGIDVTADVRDLPFEEKSCEEIRATQLIEHIPRNDVLPMLKHWYKLLAKNGKVMVTLPNFDKLAQNYLNGVEPELMMEWIFGNQKHKGQFHCWGYSFKTLSELFKKAGFIDIEKIKDREYPPCFGIIAKRGEL